MRVLILHDRVEAGSSADAADALVQARLVAGHLRGAGHEVAVRGATLELSLLIAEIESSGLVVNLVESLEGRGSLIHLVPAVVEAMGSAMTGCPARAIAATSDKLTAKRMMRAHGIATPEWCETGGESPATGRWIVKSVWEHASIGLGAGSIVDAAACDVLERVEASRGMLGGEAFAERFIDGREFNLSVLEIDGEPMVLPAAEIRFVGYGDDRPQIVDYAAKWDESSYAYHHTPRVFEFGARDAALLDELRGICVRCWDVFGLRGYARIDFRVDASGVAWVLEVNSNPCLSPDAGFMAAAERGGLTSGDVIDLLVSAALTARRGTVSNGAG